jgi:SAM-dependent methyltransferase
VADVIAVARHHFPELRFRAGTMAEVLAAPGFTPYDIVLCSEVIEHVPHSEQMAFVRTMARLLRPGGFAIITTPRAEAFAAWMAVTNNSRQPVDDWLSEQELSRSFSAAGFTSIGSDRIHVSLRDFRYHLTPTGEQLASPEFLPLYQVAAFQLSAAHHTSETQP